MTKIAFSAASAKIPLVINGQTILLDSNVLFTFTRFVNWVHGEEIKIELNEEESIKKFEKFINTAEIDSKVKSIRDIRRICWILGGESLIKKMDSIPENEFIVAAFLDDQCPSIFPSNEAIRKNIHQIVKSGIIKSLSITDIASICQIVSDVISHEDSAKIIADSYMEHGYVALSLAQILELSLDSIAILNRILDNCSLFDDTVIWERIRDPLSESELVAGLRALIVEKVSIIEGQQKQIEDLSAAASANAARAQSLENELQSVRVSNEREGESHRSQLESLLNAPTQQISDFESLIKLLRQEKATFAEQARKCKTSLEGRLAQKEQDLHKMQEEMNKEIENGNEARKIFQSQIRELSMASAFWLPFKPDSFDGIFQCLNRQSNGNMTNTQIVRLEAAHVWKGNLISTIDGTCNIFSTESDKNAYWMVDFVEKRVQIIGFSIKTICTNNAHFQLRHFKVEGSEDKTKWKKIAEKNVDEELKGPNRVGNYQCALSPPYRYLKLSLCNPNEGDFWYVAFSRIEFFGNLQFKLI
jgi:hypothetical protein